MDESVAGWPVLLETKVEDVGLCMGMTNLQNDDQLAKSLLLLINTTNNI